MDPDVKARWKFAIMGLLGFCKKERRPASIVIIKRYLDDSRAQGKLVAEARQALLWFVAGARRAEKRANPQSSELGAEPQLTDGSPGRFALPVDIKRERSSDRSMPSIGAADLGGPEWEQALIKALRMAGHAWRTEVTYREWAARFAAFIQPREPRSADRSDVKAFLEDLVVSKRVGASSQKQALNALVFFFEEGLGIHLGDFSDYQRALPGRRVPTVLTRRRCGGCSRPCRGRRDSWLRLRMAAGCGCRNWCGCGCTTWTWRDCR